MTSSSSNMAQAVVLRSQVAHANIRRIDVAAAREMPGVLLGAHRRRREGRRTRRRSMPRAAQQPRRLAAASTRRAQCSRSVRCAMSANRSRWSSPRRWRRRRTPPMRSRSTTRPLPAVTDARAALEKGAPQLFDSFPATLCSTGTTTPRTFAATDAAFAKAAHVTTLEIVNNRVVVNSMEPRNAIGDWDAAAGRPVLYTGTQGSHFVRDPLAEAVLKLPKEKLRVVTPPNVGGGFGMKAFVYPEQALGRMGGRQAQAAGALAVGSLGGLHLRQPGPRSLTPGPSSRSTPRGKFLGTPRLAHRQCRAPTCRRWVRSFRRARPILISGLYTTPAIAINVKGVCTNTVPVCAYRGAGRPEASYLIERLVDAAARELNMTPDKIRRINLIPPEGHSLHVADQTHLRLGRVREGDGPRHGKCRLEGLQGAAQGERRSAASCVASAWRPTRSAAAADFPRPPRSSSRATASTS